MTISDIESAVSLFRRRWQDKLPNRLTFIANVRLEGNKSLLGGATLSNGSVVVGNHCLIGVLNKYSILLRYTWLDHTRKVGNNFQRLSPSSVNTQYC